MLRLAAALLVACAAPQRPVQTCARPVPVSPSDPVPAGPSVNECSIRNDCCASPLVRPAVHCPGLQLLIYRDCQWGCE